MAQIIPREVWLQGHGGNPGQNNSLTAQAGVNHGKRNLEQLFSIPGLFPSRNLSIALLMLASSSNGIGLKAGLLKLEYVEGEIIESLPKLAKFATVLTQNLYEQTIKRFMDGDLVNEFESVYGSIKFNHNGVISKMNPLGIFLAEMSEDPNFFNLINIISTETTNIPEIAYINRIKQIKDLNLMQINRNIAFFLATLEKTGFAENLLTATVVIAIGKCLEQKDMKEEDLATLNSENLSIEQLVNLISIYDLTIEDYEFIESFVAFEGVFLIPQKDGSQQLIIPILSKDRSSDIEWDANGSANPTFIYVKRNSVSDPTMIYIFDTHHTAKGEGVSESSSKVQTSTSNPSTGPTLKSIDRFNTVSPSNSAASKVNVNSHDVNENGELIENEENASDSKAREDREKLETRVILSDEQLEIYWYGTNEEKRNLIQELSGIKPPKTLKSRVYEKLPKVETLPAEDVVKLEEIAVTDQGDELETFDTSEESNLLVVKEPKQERIIEYQDLPNIEPIYQQILQSADLSLPEIAELDSLNEEEIIQIVELADTFADLYNDL